MNIIWDNSEYLAHYGMPRRSGRYKWGSGEDPYHHGDSIPRGKKKDEKDNIKRGKELLKSKSRLERKAIMSRAKSEVQRNAANDKSNPLRSLNRVNEKYYDKKAKKYGAKIDAKNKSLKKKINRNNIYANMQTRAAQDPNNPLRAVNRLNEKHYRKKYLAIIKKF